MTDKTLEAVARAIYERDPFTTKFEEIEIPFDELESYKPIVMKTAKAAIDAHDSELKKHIKVLVEALERLARLGNGTQYGNSDGNVIAQQALASLPPELRGL